MTNSATASGLLFNINSLIQGSKWFTWHEALWLESIQSYAVPTQAQVNNILATAKVLDQIRAHFGKPVNVSSWLRPPVYNKEIVKGATNSFHIQGLAVDFQVQGLDPELVRKELRLLRSGGFMSLVSMELGVGWVHIQLDGRGVDFYPGPRKVGA